MGRCKFRPPRDPKFTPKQIRELRKKEKLLKTEIARIAAREVEHAGISTYELAEVLGYKTASQFSKWKSGAANVPIEKVALMAEALGYSITRFFPAHLYQREWVDDILLAVEKGQRKRAMEILLEHLPEDVNSEDM